MEQLIFTYLDVGVGLARDKLDSNGEEIGFHSRDCELHHPSGVGGVNDRQSPFQDMLLGIKLVLSRHFTHHWCSHTTPVGLER